jgi:DNA-binding beta-propeller fold protein YncE
MYAMPRNMRLLQFVLIACVLLLAACSNNNDGLFVDLTPPREPGPGPAPLAPELLMDQTTPAPGIPMSFPDGIAVFPGPNGEELIFHEGNRQRRILIDSIDNPPLVHDVVIESAANGGRDSNAQICVDAQGNRIFGEDTGQGAAPPAFAHAGWGVFDRNMQQVGKLTPTSVSPDNQLESFGCGLARDGSGRLFVSELGSQAVGATTGQLIVWFPDPDQGFRVWPGNVPASGYPNDKFSDNYCKIAIDLSAASSIAVDANNNVYVANAGNGTVTVFHPPFPTGPDFAGGCSGTDKTGAPMVDPTLGDPLDREVFVAAGVIFSPSGIVQSPVTGNWYVSSVFDGKILEYSADGTTIYQTILDPANNIPPESPFTPGGLPLSSGHPYGLALDSKGTLYFTDMQLQGTLPRVGPAGGKGKVWRIRFRDE